ncbi:MAG: hypothetical protein ACR2N4_02405 [Jatrophihabitans sp.]
MTDQPTSADKPATARPAKQAGPVFSAPVTQTSAPRADRPVTPAFGVGAQHPAPSTAPSQGPDRQSLQLAEQLTEQTATVEQDQEWIDAGLGRHYAYLIEQCKRHGLTPQDLRTRVDGQSLASRLKNGESVSSVRSRIS